MTRLSLLDKLMILFNMIKGSNLFLMILGILIVIFIIIGIITVKNKKLGKTIYLLGLGSILGYLVISYQPNLLKMFQYMMDNFFIALYFPTLAIYLAAIIIMNIIIFKTVFSNKSSKIIKIINTIVYFIMNYLLLLNLNVITKENLDVFDQSSIYQNDNARALIELSSIIFIIWIIFLIIYKCIYEYLIKDLPKRKKNYKIVESPTIAYSEENIKEFVIKEEKNYQITSSPSMIKGKKKKVQEKDYVFTTTPDTIQGKAKKEKEYTFIDAPEQVKRNKTTITVEEEYVPRKRKKTVWKQFVDFMLMKEEQPIAKKIVSPKESLQRNYQINSIPEYVQKAIKEKSYQSTNMPNIIRGKKIDKKPELNDKSFTLEDYKLFSEILKNHKNNKAKEVPIENNIKQEVLDIEVDNKYQAMDNYRSEKIFGSMDDIREEQKKEIIEIEKERRKLLNKQINRQRKIDLKEEQEILERKRQNEEQREQNKMTELERLYQGINF